MSVPKKVMGKLKRGAKKLPPLRQLSAMRIGQLEAGHSLRSLQGTLMQINHNQMVILERLDQRTKNSGSMYLSKEEMATKLFSGLKLYIDPRDVTLSVHLALDSIWEHDITQAWLKVVKPNDVVVDIGANYGYFGALAAQKIFNSPKSQFLFFEANPYLIPYIKRSLAANWLIDKCKIENLALSDKAGTVEFSASPYYLGNGTLTIPDGTEAYDAYRIREEEIEIQKVPATTLDAYCKEQKIREVNLIKMDIEGHEQKAYAGMRKIIKASPDVTMFIEFTREGYDNPKKFYEQMLSDFGYVYTIQEGGVITKPKNTSYEAIIESVDGWVMPIFSKNKKLV